VGFQLVVDKDSITQALPLNEVSYHAGDGTGEGNYRTIGIEICENDDIEQCIANAKILIAWLMNEYNFTTSVIKPHLHYSPWNKVCPRIILTSVKTWKTEWSRFLSSLQGVYDSLYKKTPPKQTTPPKQPPTATSKI